jgi:quercetin dioxygenase-like cupin family protein
MTSMTTSDRHDTPQQPGFAVSHARDASWDDGLRGFFAYRDLGVASATDGRVGAHVIRARGASTEPGERHRHRLEFQLVYVLRGWVEFDYDGVGRVRLEAGSSVVQPPGIGHAELAHSADLEMLEITLPARFETEQAEVQRPER